MLVSRAHRPIRAVHIHLAGGVVLIERIGLGVGSYKTRTIAVEPFARHLTLN